MCYCWCCFSAEFLWCVISVASFYGVLFGSVASFSGVATRRDSQKAMESNPKIMLAENGALSHRLNEIL